MVAGTVCILILSKDGLDRIAAGEVHGRVSAKFEQISSSSGSQLASYGLITNKMLMAPTILPDGTSALWFGSIWYTVGVRQSEGVPDATAVGRGG